MLQVFPHIDTEMATSTVQYICGHKFYQNIFLFLIYRYLQDTNNISTTTAWTLSWAAFFCNGIRVWVRFMQKLSNSCLLYKSNVSTFPLPATVNQHKCKVRKFISEIRHTLGSRNQFGVNPFHTFIIRSHLMKISLSLRPYLRARASWRPSGGRWSWAGGQL